MTKPQKPTSKKTAMLRYTQVVKSKAQLADELSEMLRTTKEFAVAHDLSYFAFSCETTKQDNMMTTVSAHNVSKSDVLAVMCSM